MGFVIGCYHRRQKKDHVTKFTIAPLFPPPLSTMLFGMVWAIHVIELREGRGGGGVSEGGVEG